MKKIQKKKGVTILALVITIIIMLLLAGVVMQMALGDNGLIAKVSQSKIEQAKAELYETARIEYLSLKTKAIAKDEEEPPVSEVLSAEGFLAKYDVNGDNITDKKGEVIDTKDNLLAKLSGMVGQVLVGIVHQVRHQHQKHQLHRHIQNKVIQKQLME